MKRPIVINGTLREAEIEYVTRPDFQFLDQWRQSLGNDTHPVRADAVDLATLACKRYKAHAPVEHYATRQEDIGDYVRDNPYSEVATLVVMRCRWFPESDIVGLAHFRRSWYNNLILDYLASHPWVASPPAGYDVEVKGVGLALLYFICATAVQNNCEAVWGEATQNSCEFYKRVFKLDRVRDLFYIPKENLANFRAEQDRKWQRRK
jgi:hypothetical protein